MAELWMVGHLLRRCHQVNGAIWAAVFNDCLTPPQYAALGSVVEQGPLGPLEIGRVAGLDRSTAVDVVRRLEEAGWLHRTPDERDRRRQLLALTAPARLAMRTSRGLAEAANQEFLVPLPAPDHPRLIEALQLLARVEPRPATATSAPSPATTAGHLVRLALQHHQALWAAAFPGDLTRPQFAVLRMLQTAGPTPQNRLSGATSLDAATLSAVLSRLQARGHVARMPSASDRRQKKVLLTSAGEVLVRDAMGKAVEVQRATLQPLSTPEWPWLHDALARLAFRGDPPAPHSFALSREPQPPARPVPSA